jgi:hypothetical protein
MRQRAVRSVVVVFAAERVEQLLEFGDGGRLLGPGAEPFLAATVWAVTGWWAVIERA